MIHARSRHTWALLAAGVLTLVVGLTAGGVASAQTKSLTVGSKDFSGAQAISQAYGQALENKGYDITFKDNLGATEIVYKALENGDLDGYADYQGTLLTYLGGEPTSNSAETYKALQAKLAGTGIVASKPAPAVDVNGFYVTKATAKKYKLSKRVGPHQGRPQAHVRDATRVRGAAALPRRQVAAALRAATSKRSRSSTRVARSPCRRSRTTTCRSRSSSPGAA